MSSITPLSTGVLEHIMKGEEIDNPVLQVLGIKKIVSSDSVRLRLLISDGKYFNSFTMLATQLNHLYDDGLLCEFTIIQIPKYITSIVSKNDGGKRVLIILELNILNNGSDVGRKIGEPISYTDAPSNSGSIGKNAGAANASASGSSSEAKPTRVDQKPNLSSLHGSSNNNNNTLTEMESGFTVPITALSPYQNKWVIKARVTAKTPIRTWSNAKGEGKLFSMDLMDQTGEIRATAFRDACDKFYDLIEVDRIYYITKCQLKPANKQFTTLKNDYEMTFTNDTMVKLCEDDDGGEAIPEIKYDLVPISQIADLEPKVAVDTIGICKDIGDLATITSRTTNKEFKKRELTLVDSSNAAVNLTLWGDDAVNFEGHVQPVILVKGARVTEFNGGKSISMGNGSIMKLNPDIPECHKLRGWYDNGGAENVPNFVSARTGTGGSFNTEWLTFQEARAKDLGNGDKPDYFQCKAVVHVVKTQNAYYKACPQPDCNKKVVDEGAEHYRCERCNALFPNFKYRLLVNMSVGDWTANRWVTCFSDVAEQLLKRPANQIGEALENDPALAEEIFSAIHFHSYIFKLRVKNEVYGDVTRNKITVQSATPINYKEYNKHLISGLKEMTGIGKA